MGRRYLTIMETYMMKPNSKAVFLSMVVAASFVAIPSSPVEGIGVSDARRVIDNARAVVAQEQAGLQDRIQAGTQGGVKNIFCDNLDQATVSISEKMSGVRSRIDRQREARDSAMEGKRNTQDESLNGIRSTRDARRIEWYAKLDDQATTDARKTAVEDFKKTVDDAIDARRDTVDDAVATFRSDVDALVSGKKTSVGSVADDFQNAFDTAIEKAKADCGAGKDTTAVKNAFRTSLKSAKDTLATERKAVDGIGSRIDALSTTRDTAVRKAVDAFGVTIKSATETLKTALSKSE